MRNNEQGQPICDYECEQLVMGTLLSYSRVWSENADLLSAGLFYDPKLNAIYKAAKCIRDNGDDANMVSVMPELLKDKTNQITPLDLTEVASHVALADVRPYVLHLSDMERRRRLVYIARRAEQGAYDMAEPVDTVQASAMDELGNLFKSAATNIKSLAEVAEDFMQNVVQHNREGKGAPIVPTGFSVLDERGGLQPSDMMVIGAESSQGKTAFAMTIATHAARCGYPVAVYSMEMTARQLCARMLAAETAMPSNVLNTRRLDDAQMGRCQDAASKIGSLPVFFDEQSTNTLDGILASIRTMVCKHGVKVAVVDYLQILNVNTKITNKEQAMAEAARKFKNIAKQLDISVILLSQLSRDRADPRPTISRLRDSGQIAEAADTVVLLYRPEVYGQKFRYPDEFAKVSTQGTAMVDVCKGRNTGRARFIVGFDGPRTTFRDLSAGNLPECVEAAPVEPYDPDNDNPF